MLVPKRERAQDPKQSDRKDQRKENRSRLLVTGLLSEAHNVGELDLGRLDSEASAARQSAHGADSGACSTAV